MQSTMIRAGHSGTEPLDQFRSRTDSNHELNSDDGIR